MASSSTIYLPRQTQYHSSLAANLEEEQHSTFGGCRGEARARSSALDTERHHDALSTPKRARGSSNATPQGPVMAASQTPTADTLGYFDLAKTNHFSAQQQPRNKAENSYLDHNNQDLCQPGMSSAAPMSSAEDAVEGGYSSSSPQSVSGSTTPATSVEGPAVPVSTVVAAFSSPELASPTTTVPSPASEKETLLPTPLLTRTSATPSSTPQSSQFPHRLREVLSQESPITRVRRPNLVRSTSASLEAISPRLGGMDLPPSQSLPAGSLGSLSAPLHISRSKSLPSHSFYSSSQSDTEDGPSATQQDAALFSRRMSDIALNDKFGAAARASQRHARACERRYRSLLEFVETEEAYLQDLAILKDVYFSALNFTSVHPVARSLIRRNLSELQDWHEALNAAFQNVNRSLQWRLSEVATAEGKWDDAKVLAAIEAVMSSFIRQAHGLRLYESFCSRHGDALSLLRQHQLDPVAWQTYMDHCNTVLEARFPQACIGPRLSLQDYLIKPIQRICRYPLMLSQLNSYLDAQLPEEAPAARKVQEALGVVRGAAAAVDAAKLHLLTEKRTKLIADRFDLPEHEKQTFVNLLGQVDLCGSLYFVEPSSSSEDNSIKIKYYGCFLYENHVVLAKIKRRTAYETRHWFPLRAFEVESLPDGESALPFSLRLTHGGYRCELAATCAQERDLWFERFSQTASRSRAKWMQAVYNDPVAPPSSDLTISSISIDSEVLSSVRTPDSEDGPAGSPFLRANTSASSLVSLGGRSRFSMSASNFLGMSTAGARDSIDLRLAEVFSDAVLKARESGEDEVAALTMARPRLLQGLRTKSDARRGQPQATPLARRATSRDIQRRKSVILESCQPVYHRPSQSVPAAVTVPAGHHERRSSADAAIPDSALGEVPRDVMFLHRSKTNPGKPRDQVTAPAQSKRGWTGTLRHRTTSFLGSQNSSPSKQSTLDQQVGVARNDSSSSSGSSRDVIRTPSPMSSGPPSPLIAPTDALPLRDSTPTISRQSSYAGSNSGLSPDQEQHAMRAASYLYDNSDKDTRMGWSLASLKKRPSVSGKLHGRSPSSTSLLSLFTPALSPPIPSPIGEHEPAQQQKTTPSSSPNSSCSVLTESPTESTNVSLAEIGLNQARLSPPALQSPPPPRRQKTTRRLSMFPLTRLSDRSNSTPGA